MHLICASQLLAMGSKRRIWLPDVLHSSCSKFLSLPRPSRLSFILCFLLSPCPVCCHAVLQLGTVISPWDERCNVGCQVGLWASTGNHADAHWCCCGRERRRVALQQRSADLHWQQSRSNSRVPVSIFYQDKATAKLLNTFRASGRCSLQCNFPASRSTFSPSTLALLKSSLK